MILVYLHLDLSKQKKMPVVNVSDHRDFSNVTIKTEDGDFIIIGTPEQLAGIGAAILVGVRPTTGTEGVKEHGRVTA